MNKVTVNNIEIINSQIKTLKCDLILQRVDALAHVGGVVTLAGLTLSIDNTIGQILTLLAGGICLCSTLSLNKQIVVNKCELSELENQRDIVMNGRSF